MAAEKPERKKETVVVLEKNEKHWLEKIFAWKLKCRERRKVKTNKWTHGERERKKRKNQRREEKKDEFSRKIN